LTADIAVLAYTRIHDVHDHAALSIGRVAAFLLGLSFFCWAHLTISRQPFPGSPASHDIGLYAAPVIAMFAIVAAWRNVRLVDSRVVIAGGLLWVLACVATSRGALDPALALSWTVSLVVALCLILAGVDRRAMAAAMAIGVAASLPVMLFQVAAQTTWPAATIQGWAGGELSPAVKGAAVLGEQRWLRPYGLMPHPNIAGGIAAIACVLLASVWLREGRLWQLLSVAAAFSETLLSFSRSAWIGAICGLAVLAFVRRGDLRGLSLALILPGLLFACLFGGLVLQRVQASGTLEDNSLSQRMYLVQTALLFWRQHPLAGIGPAQFSQAEVDLYGQAFIPEPVHNAVFLVLAETGSVGLLGAALVVVGVAGRVVRAREWETLAAGLAVLSPLMLDHYFMTFSTGLILVAAMLACSMPAASAGHKNRLPLPVRTV